MDCDCDEKKQIEATEPRRQTSTEKEAVELKQEATAMTAGAAAMAQVLNKTEVATCCSLLGQLIAMIPMCCWQLIVYVSLCKCFRKPSQARNSPS